ncbi:DUF6542 domain-containing protein [Corynebacterium alimapuense]|uniref:Gamma-aminobutyrate permease n=1 Tax=Corynebacterium alimapuense TaxID=1576874 RepID=A0A3M8K5P9_9CORY|nr:DUF6542 domain-containing protein [Corynebacterium alimapuense]RNE48506.1 gamma-aminobutyrate permease [Corynebacterium alimapuense]
MSNSSPKNKSAQATSGFAGLPTWSGIAIVIAALTTGLLLSINAQQISWPYLLFFAVAGIAVALLTEVRGLFLTIASMPLLFAIMTLLTSWSIGRSLSAEGSAAFSTTSIVTAIYPLVQFFPTLMIVTLIATALAVLRVWVAKRNAVARASAATRHRRRAAEANRRNRDTTSRARNRANEITVEELLARNRRRETSTAAQPPRPETPRAPRAEPQRSEPRRPDPRSPEHRHRLDDDFYS